MVFILPIGVNGSYSSHERKWHLFFPWEKMTFILYMEEKWLLFFPWEKIALILPMG
jgi:hypothetical protein